MAKDAGKSNVEAKNIGLKVASDTAKSYSEALRVQPGNSQISNPVGSSIGGARTRKPVGATMTPVQREATVQPNLQGKKWQYNNKRKHITPYKKGTADSNNNYNIAAKRPSYLDNKCIVVSRINRDMTIPQLQSYVNDRAQRNIKFLHKPINLAYEYSAWRTLAIELNDHDYELLSKPEFWDSKIRLKDYVGRRWWRNQASNLSANERQSSMRQQWNSA